MRDQRNRSDRGATSVEYGLIVSLIAAVIVGSVLLFGGGVTDLFTDTCESFANPGNLTTQC